MTRSYSNFLIPPLNCANEFELPAVALEDQANGASALQISVDERPTSHDWRVTREQRDLAVRTFRESGLVNEASRSAGIAWSTARNLLTDELARSGRRPPEWHAMSEAEIAEAVRLRTCGWSYKRIGEKFEVSRQAVSKHLGRRAAAAD